MFIKTFGCAVLGINATIITIETNVIQGLNCHLVGLPDSTIKEAIHRVESSIKLLGYYFPRTKVIINLAPADIRKEGSAYDLPIALSVIYSSGQITFPHFEKFVIMGELSLDGILRPIKGALPIALEAKKQGFKSIILPFENAFEASVVDELTIYGVKSLDEAIQLLSEKKSFTPIKANLKDFFENKNTHYEVDFSSVQGQEGVKRALEVAAAGGHNVIMIGPPGAGKTMMAKRLPSILPPLSLAEALETTKIHSVAGKLSNNKTLIATRPFRNPHHTISNAALVGGGTNPQPGEISLAHNGILFLDELPEFNRMALEVLRQPLEDRKVLISRAKWAVEFPANFMLIASMNPCPCGYYNHPTKDCLCKPQTVQKYLNKISGPLLDRFDIQIEIQPVNFEEMTSTLTMEKSSSIRERIIQAREIQLERFHKQEKIFHNSMMGADLVKEFCYLNDACQSLLKIAMEKLQLSGRAYDRIVKVSRTIADLEGSIEIAPYHLAEAINYRNMDRSAWGV